MTSHGGKNITIYDIPGLLGEAYPKAFSPANIISGFRVSGIFPFDSNIFRDDEFCSSLITDRINPMGETPDSDASELPRIRSPSPQPGPSGHRDQSPVQPSVSTMVSPMEVFPFPKAPPRVTKQATGRKRGRCGILADTPEKQESEAEQAERQKRASGVKKNFSKTMKIPKNKNNSKKDNE